jgi:hypothetical protein
MLEEVDRGEGRDRADQRRQCNKAQIVFIDDTIVYGQHVFPQASHNLHRQPRPDYQPIH